MIAEADKVQEIQVKLPNSSLIASKNASPEEIKEEEKKPEVKP